MKTHSFLGRRFRDLIPRHSVVTLVALAALAWASPAYSGEIHDAAKNGDLAKVKVLLRETPDLVFSKDERGSTPLHDASTGIGNKQPTPHSSSATGSSSDEDFAAENELLGAANKSRELAGVPPLRMEESLREAARAHARRMVENERLEHRLPGELSLIERIARVSPLRRHRAGENIANAGCAAGANDVLMHSTPHRENLLDRGFNIAGIAAIWRKGPAICGPGFRAGGSVAQQSRKLVGPGPSM